MSRKADSSSHRTPRRRAAREVPAETPRSPRKAAPPPEPAHDSDFGLALAVGTALRRRPDA